jgi:transposase InsO family protein
MDDAYVYEMKCNYVEAKHLGCYSFGTPRMVISNGGSHFIDKTFRAFLKELGVKHNIATPYHPQKSG